MKLPSIHRGRSAAPQLPRGPALVYTALLVVLVVAIAGLAFSSAPPAPPQIAEFAPQANQQIHKAPSQLNSSIGSGAGGSGGTTTTTAAAPAATLPNGQPVPTTTPGSVVVPAVHHCFGNPPAQIDTDTQGPPCVAYWVGNNGGATSRGVTATTIRISTSSNDFPARMANDMELWINRNFELYGRQVQLVQAEGAPSTCAEEEGMADGLAASGFFAATDPNASADACFFSEAAHDHLLAVQYEAQAGMTSQILARFAPYVYTYTMPWDEQLRLDGAFICSQLAGKTARYAPEASLSIRTRKFGLILLHDDTPWQVTYSPLTDALASCGAAISPSDIEVGSFTQGSQSADTDIAQFATTSVTRMDTDNVTTVLCAAQCAGFATGQDFASAASGQAYYPEWIFLDTCANRNIYVRVCWDTPNEQNALMNLVFEPPQVPYADEPLNRAINQVDPSYSVDESSLTFDDANRGYEQLLLLASCIQMAGPDLTPSSFERGCQAASFPNPYSPEMEGIVSFAGGSLSMTTDATVMWWSNSAPSVYPDEGAGTWCYAEGGRRFTAASFAASGNILPPSFATAPCANSPPGS